MSYLENNVFQIADDAVPLEAIPVKTTYSGTRIPGIGLGTFGSDRYMAKDIAEAVIGAAEVGYRHFDCASVYGNEKEIGESLKIIMKGGIAREDLFITSKVWNDMHGEGQVIESCKQSLRDLGLDYLDMYLIHWPFPNYHPPGCNVSSRSPEAKPYIHENYMRTWRQMEQLGKMGLVKEIGTSNMTIPKMKLLLRDSRIKPAVNEMELHPHFQQKDFFNFLINNQILPIGFSPIGSPSRPTRDRTKDDTVDIEDPAITAPAKRLGVHPAAICLKWAVQRGHIPIPFSVRRHQYLANLQAVAGEPLSNEEMGAIANITISCRLIKGQVFLWKENQTWEDLWDLDGTITPP